MASVTCVSEEIAFEQCSGTSEGFANALLIWINKPHVVNRRLCGSRTELVESVPKSAVTLGYVTRQLDKLGLTFNTSVPIETVFKEKDSSTQNDSSVTFVVKEAELGNMADNTADNITDSTALQTADLTADKMADQMADQIANEVADKMADQMANEMADQMANEMADQMANEMADQLANEMADQLANEMADQLANETADKMADQMANEMADQMANEMVDQMANEMADQMANEMASNITDNMADNITASMTTNTVDNITGNTTGNSIYNALNKTVDLEKCITQLKGDKVMVIVRQMLPEQPERHCNIPELLLFDKASCHCLFVPLKRKEDKRSAEVLYSFTFSTQQQTGIYLHAGTTDCTADSERKLSLTWIENQLLHKLARWSEQNSLRTQVTSLRLVSVEDYSRLYSELKNRYGLHFAKIWPEKTNPEKFVFEDVAIATYLICLWSDERVRRGLTRKQSFIDLGCGNGLLVHILASEGYPGYGVDVRRRNIWDLYGPETILKETSITPSDESVFPDTDWLIGNHSDELTPWIPVMTARSSYNCNFFVLPCCFWDFNSRYSFTDKCQRGGDDGGKYRLYLDYIQQVGEKCDFKVEEDILRIPSTKRVCFIGQSRTYDVTSESAVDKTRQTFLSSRCSRDTTRNVKDVATHNGEKGGSIKEDGHSWRKGGSLTMGEVVGLFDKELLQELKCECGGLQTLLRNHCHIFQVSKGEVCLRDFTLVDPFEGRCSKGRNTDKTVYMKTTMCWFYEHHPDGCPKSAELCAYAHGADELRAKPVKSKT